MWGTGPRDPIQGLVGHRTIIAEKNNWKPAFVESQELYQARFEGKEGQGKFGNVIKGGSEM